ncbi:uncharacterized protein LOC124124531 [Haliotis rufescens]|uniref:uncharacterized protein LOC124124531 n=1 Tax=Haliotis rufescens TaxID=6454 RepID=UPI001EAFD143|nr:uncharacterized protein LOC124124531 [Haliotis rufescens]
MASNRIEKHRKDIEATCTETLENKKRKEKRFMTQRMSVNDRSTSVSSWTLPMMCKHINFRADVSDWGNDQSDAIISEHDWKVRCEEKILQDCRTEARNNYDKGIERSTPTKNIRDLTETDVRYIVDGMISPLLDQLHLRRNTEETIDMDPFPNCRLDYILKTAQDIPIGAIEVKRDSTLDKTAYAQAVIQLLILQQWAYKKGVPFGADMTRVPIVNILTDGERFMLLKIKGEKLFVEKSWPKSEGSILRRLTLRCISDTKTFHNVYDHLHRALYTAVSKLRQQLDPPTPTLDERKMQSDDDGSQGRAPVQRQIDVTSQSQVSLDPVSNEEAWKTFLSPLTPRKRKKMDDGIDHRTIEGPASLSRKLGTRLGETFYKKRKNSFMSEAAVTKFMKTERIKKE